NHFMNPRYRDASLPVDERVLDLLERMNLDEKLAQLGSTYVYEILDRNELDPDRAARIMAHGIGHISRIGGASALEPCEVAEIANAIQHDLATRTRLGIPAIVHEECLAGVMAKGATVFPQGIGVAATWDPDISYAMGRAIARQMRAGGAHQGLAPVLDVCRDPRWGRVEETSGEDPYLVACMGVATVRGLQAGGKEGGVIATAKHFAGHGAPEGGMNSAPPHISPRELHEVFLFPFEAAVRVAGVRSFMHAYHEIDGIPCIANRDLLVDTLRDQWGFDGTMVSDYNGVEELVVTHRLVPTLTEAAAASLEAGVDVELPNTAGYGEPLKAAIESGRLDEAFVDRSVARILRQKFDLGLFEDPDVPASGMKPSADDKALAQAAAQASFVLLKNDGAVLPLGDTGGSVAVIGPSADDARLLLGDYSFAAALEIMEEARIAVDAFSPAPHEALPEPDLSGIPTMLDAVVRRAGDSVEVKHARGCEVSGTSTDGFAEAVAVAAEADVAVLFMGGKSGMTLDATTGEFRDRTNINLPGVQEQLLKAVAATGTPVVLVLVSGRPLSPDVSRADAVLHVWLPGEHGAEAAAGVLFGDVSPGGKLPITIPRNVGQIPIYHGHKPTGGRSRLRGEYVDASNTPLYPFGYGLSYTSFKVSAPQLASSPLETDGVVSVSVAVANIGSMAGDEVVQIYARRESAPVTRPVRELVGFKRIHLEPGVTRTLSFELAADQFGFYDREMRYAIHPGTVTISAGTSSSDVSGSVNVELVGPVIVDPRRTFFSAVEVS
ncbi:MAG: glycoside hydrolase family 3 N-terminal domain-containing protein, partial [Acidimicrobiia bacterium]